MRLAVSQRLCSVERGPGLLCLGEVECGDNGCVVGFWVLAVDGESDGLVVE